MTKTLVSHHRTLLKCCKGLPGAFERFRKVARASKLAENIAKVLTCKLRKSAIIRRILGILGIWYLRYEASASIITDMYLIPTPRASAQWLTVSLLVGVELANKLRQLFAQTDSICVYRGNIRDLVYGSGVVV